MAEASLHGDDKLRDSLDLIVASVVRSIDAVDAASITVFEPEDQKSSQALFTLTAHGELAASADKLQYELGEGPCVDAAKGQPIVQTRDVAGDARWPQYGPRVASQLGVRSQLAFTIFSEKGTCGGLNLYSTSTHSLSDENVLATVELFAAQTAAVMGRAATVKQLTEALATRKVIGQAIGLLMERYCLDEGRAFQFLVRMSSVSETKLRNIAEEIVATANEKAVAGG